MLSIALGICGLAIAINYTGVFQLLELSILDRWFCLRPDEAPEQRIVIVTMSESDLNYLQQWPISDLVLSRLISQIKQQKPRAIGLDLYRNLAVKPGTKKLEVVLRNTPNLIGVEKALNETIPPSPILKEQDRVAFADLVIDVDNKIRRGLLAIQLDNGEVQLSLSTRLALMYLAGEGIELQAVEGSPNRSLGNAVFIPLRQNNGGYVRADAGGFQVLLNFRGTETSFKRVSIIEVLEGNIPDDLLRDRIVLIGSTAESLNDLFPTPYSKEQNISQYLPGVMIHANLTSQIISAALDDRQLIRAIGEPFEWLWIFSWASIGTSINLFLCKRSSFSQHYLSLWQSTAICIIIPGVILFGSGYLLFISGWWLPVITPLFSLIASTIAVGNYHQQNQKKLAFIDGLTKIPNRRSFDRFLQRHWLESKRKNQNLCLILCDVDYFKKYNDTYGHQAGDLCLKKVAQAISKTVRERDIAARYGGEEFAIILPNTSPEVAMKIAQRIGILLKNLKLPHSSSPTNNYVSLSCGVASTSKILVDSPEDLIINADRALYQAKARGRNRAILNN